VVKNGAKIRLQSLMVLVCEDRIENGFNTGLFLCVNMDEKISSVRIEKDKRKGGISISKKQRSKRIFLQ
jgi:hypothetical protein